MIQRLKLFESFDKSRVSIGFSKEMLKYRRKSIIECVDHSGYIETPESCDRVRWSASDKLFDHFSSSSVVEESLESITNTFIMCTIKQYWALRKVPADFP